MTSSSDYQKTEQMETTTKQQGQNLTREQLSDVYAAGTSDGVVQLEEGAVKIPNVGYDEGNSSKHNN